MITFHSFQYFQRKGVQKKDSREKTIPGSTDSTFDVNLLKMQVFGQLYISHHHEKYFKASQSFCKEKNRNPLP